MSSTRRKGAYWWSSFSDEQFWIELLNTDRYGDRLFAPDSGAYGTMQAVNVGDIVLRWHSERHPGVRAGESGIYGLSRVLGPCRPSEDRWEGKVSVEAPLSRKVYLRRPILLKDLKLREGELKANLDRLKDRVSPLPPHSLWQFPSSGIKPVTRYLTKLTVEDLGLLISDHPHLAEEINLTGYVFRKG